MHPAAPGSSFPRSPNPQYPQRVVDSADLRVTREALSAPGARRMVVDAERAAVLAFCDKYPEWSRQPHDVVVQALCTMRTEAEHAEEDLLRAEAPLTFRGARADWHRADDGEAAA